MIYYVTLNGNDFEYCKSLEHARKTALYAHSLETNGTVNVEVFTGNSHGSGGTLVKRFTVKQGKLFQVKGN